jgi:hypothetical protein
MMARAFGRRRCPLRERGVPWRSLGSRRRGGGGLVARGQVLGAMRPSMTAWKRALRKMLWALASRNCPSPWIRQALLGISRIALPRGQVLDGTSAMAGGMLRMVALRPATLERGSCLFPLAIRVLAYAIRLLARTVCILARPTRAIQRPMRLLAFTIRAIRSALRILVRARRAIQGRA